MPSDKRFIFGLGCGGCGTVSLTTLLRCQPDSCVTHEPEPRLPWLANRGPLDRALKRLLAQGEGVVGDVAPYLLPYVPMIWKRHPEARFICLQRERQSCLKSLIGKMHRADVNLYQHQIGPGQKHPGPAAAQLPKYDYAPSMEHAIGRYYDDYYHQARWFADERPTCFHIMDMLALNTADGVNGILDCLGYPKDERNVEVGIWQNASPGEGGQE